MPSTLQRLVGSAIETLCLELATPVSRDVLSLVREGRWEDLANKRVDPKHYTDATDYLKDVIAVDFLRKYKELPTGINKELVAMKNFWNAERQCFRSNRRLAPYLEGMSHPSCERSRLEFIKLVRKMLSGLLGPCPDVLDGRFGKGATYGDKGKLTTIPDKMTSRPTYTSNAVWYLFPWAGTSWAKACGKLEREPELVRGNRFEAVPKDATKFRGIAIEPSINLFYQLALGRVMKQRLKREGFDLQDGKSIHMRVACEASLSGEFATIDLSNASDTVCKNLVKLLLPHRWFERLDALRSPHTQMCGNWVRLEKFSSMGNGFTFELETAIFAAVCSAVMVLKGILPYPGKNLFVYGDDIIVPTSCARHVIYALRFLGFSTNKEKTFLSGPFRESCGGDYFKGVDVRPFYLKEEPNEPQQIIAMANGVRRMDVKVHSATSGATRILRTWFRVLDALPSHIRRLRGPEGLGDIVIADDEKHWRTRQRNSIRYVQCYRPARYTRVKWEHWHSDVVLASALYGVEDTLIGVLGNRRSAGVTPRDAVTGYKVGWVPYS